jgi:hypothetical protein
MEASNHAMDSFPTEGNTNNRTYPEREGGWDSICKRAEPPRQSEDEIDVREHALPEVKLGCEVAYAKGVFVGEDFWMDLHAVENAKEDEEWA